MRLCASSWIRNRLLITTLRSPRCCCSSLPHSSSPLSIRGTTSIEGRSIDPPPPPRSATQIQHSTQMASMVQGVFPEHSMTLLPRLRDSENDLRDVRHFFMVHVLPLLPFDGAEQAVDDVCMLLLETAPHVSDFVDSPANFSSFSKLLDRVITELRSDATSRYFSHLVKFADAEKKLWHRAVPIYRPEDASSEHALIFAEQLLHHAIVPRLFLLEGLETFGVSLSAVSLACGDNPVFLHHVVEAAQDCGGLVAVTPKSISLTSTAGVSSVLLRSLHRDIRQVTQQIVDSASKLPSASGDSRSSGGQILYSSLLAAAIGCGALPSLPLRVFRALLRTCPQQWVPTGDDNSITFCELRVRGSQLVRSVESVNVATASGASAGDTDPPPTPLEVARTTLGVLAAHPPHGLDLSRLATLVRWSRCSNIRVKTFKRFLGLFPQHFVVTNERCQLVATAQSTDLVVPRELLAVPSTDDCTESASVLSIGDVDIVVRVVLALRSSAGSTMSLKKLCENLLFREQRTAKILRMLPRDEIEMSSDGSEVVLGPLHRTDLLEQVIRAKKIEGSLRQDVFTTLILPRLLLKFHALPISQLEKWIDWTGALKARLGSMDEFVEDGLENLGPESGRTIGLWNGVRAVLPATSSLEVKVQPVAVDGKKVSSESSDREASPPAAVPHSILQRVTQTAASAVQPVTTFAMKLALLQSLRNPVLLLRLATFVLQVVFEQLIPLFLTHHNDGSSMLVSRPDEWIRDKVLWSKRHHADLGGDVMSLVRHFDGVFFEISPMLDVDADRQDSVIVSVFQGRVTSRLVFSRIISLFMVSGVSFSLTQLERSLMWSQQFQSRCGPLIAVLEMCGCVVSVGPEVTVKYERRDSVSESTSPTQSFADEVARSLAQGIPINVIEAESRRKQADNLLSQLFPLQFLELPALARLAEEFVAAYVIPLVADKGMSADDLRRRLDWHSVAPLHPLLKDFFSANPSVTPALESLLLHAASVGLLCVNPAGDLWTSALRIGNTRREEEIVAHVGSDEWLLSLVPKTPISVVELFSRTEGITDLTFKGFLARLAILQQGISALSILPIYDSAGISDILVWLN